MLGRILNKNVNFLRKKYTQCAEVPPPTESADAQMAANDPMNDGAGDVGCLQYERFSKEWQEMTMQDNFDGFRLEAGKQVAQNLQASHSLFLGTTLRETGHIYQFGPTFHDPLLGLTLVGRMGFDGGVNARAAQKIGESAEIKLNANSHLKKPDQTMYELSADYAAKDWSACLKTAWQMTWIVNGMFSQQISKNLHLGGEMTWVAANGATIGAVGARYVRGNDIWTGTLSRQPDMKQGPATFGQCHTGKIQYMRRVSDRLSLGGEYEYTPSNKESGCRLGYEYTFKMGRVQGQLDTAGRVSCFVQDFMGFGMSGLIDYVRSDYKFGFMMHIMPPPEGQPGM